MRQDESAVEPRRGRGMMAVVLLSRSTFLGKRGYGRAFHLRCSTDEKSTPTFEDVEGCEELMINIGNC